MLEVDEARRRVLDAVAPLDPIEVPVSDAAGYVLVEDAVAPHALPRFDNSAMDGYAVRAQDTTGASADEPMFLRLVGEVRAGAAGDIELGAGTAARIMTGAPLPAGADAIVPVEETREQEGRVSITAGVVPGRFVRPAGDDIAPGDTAVASGVELGAGETALLASLGFSPVRVRRRPQVAILVTGDELVPPEQHPAPGQIRDSNSVALVALVRAAGAEAALLERVPDDREGTLEAFRKAGEAADLVVSSGGVAVGKYDYVKEAVEELGRIELWRVAMQPGKPVVLGAIGETSFLGLPGNPVSIHIGFEQFVRPALLKMRGLARVLRPVLETTLATRVEKPPGRLHFVRVRLVPSRRGWTAHPTGAQGSHIQSSLVDCHGVARFPKDDTEIAAGDPVTVEVWRLPDRGERA